MTQRRPLHPGVTPELPTYCVGTEHQRIDTNSLFICRIYIMALARGLSTISTRKRKVKITKAKMAQYELDWRLHNKAMKRRGMHDLRYDSVDEYINYCLGKVKPKKEFKPFVPTESFSREVQEYPSLTKGGGISGTKKESMKYTGDLIVGIATMHKSNAVPVMKGTTQAIDIARMAK